MKDSNRLIAEFMNLNIVTLDDIRSNKNPMISSADGYTVDSLQYHASWDWIMPVVEKIESIGYCYNRYDADVCIDRQGGDTIIGNPIDETTIRPSRCLTMHEKTYQVVVEFIKWYNKNKKS